MSIANLFQGLSQGFNTYLALQQAMEEQKHQRLREGIEDQDRRDRMNLDYQREARERSAQDYAQRRDQQNASLQALRDAGIVGATPDMLDAARDGNQTQTGAGAGIGGKNLVQNAIRSLTLAQQAPGYDPSQQVDLGNGLAFQGPQFGKEQPTHFTPVIGEGNQFLSFDNKSGKFTPSNFQARQPVGSDPNNPRRYQDLQTTGGILRHDKITNTTQFVPDASGTGVAQGSLTVPSNPELAATASYNNLQSAFDGLKKNLSSVNYAAPSIGTQFAIDESKATHGPFASLRRSLANTYVGKNDPQYQAIQNSVDFLGTMVTKMVTGAQMSEPEAQRIMGILRTVAGDTPEVAQQKISNVQQIMDAEKVKAFRASGELNGNNRAPAAGGVDLKSKYGLE